MPYIDPFPDDDHSFGVAQLTEASEKWRTNRAAVTDRELQMLATYSKDFQAHGYALREQARAELAAKHIAAQTTRPAVAANGQVRMARLPKADFTNPDAINAWAAREADAACPADLFAKSWLETLTLLDAVAKRLNELRTANAALEARLVGLEAKSLRVAGSWAGTHEPGKPYREGEIVTGRGGLWIAQKDTDTSPGMAPDAWKLILRAKTAV